MRCPIQALPHPELDAQKVDGEKELAEEQLDGPRTIGHG